MEQETLMESSFKLLLAMMDTTDTRCGWRAANGRCRHLTAEQLDARAEFGWHPPDLRGVMTACAHAILWRLRPRASGRLEPTPQAPAAATSHG
jgi:hypothetical protein